MTEQRNKFDNYENALERLVFFSDAVFAIAITLLALEIRLPDNTRPDAIFQAIYDQSDALFGFALSFSVIGSYWLVHHRMFRFIKRFDGVLLWLNLTLLMFIALLPFPSSIISRFGSSIQGFLVYAVFVLSIGLIIVTIYVYAYFKHRLVDPELPEHYIKAGFLRTLVPPAVFLLSLPLGFINTTWAELSWALIIMGRFLVTHMYDKLP